MTDKEPAPTLEGKKVKKGGKKRKVRFTREERAAYKAKNGGKKWKRPKKVPPKQTKTRKRLVKYNRKTGKPIRKWRLERAAKTRAKVAARTKALKEKAKYIKAYKAKKAVELIKIAKKEGKPIKKIDRKFKEVKKARRAKSIPPPNRIKYKAKLTPKQLLRLRHARMVRRKEKKLQRRRITKKRIKAANVKQQKFLKKRADRNRLLKAKKAAKYAKSKKGRKDEPKKEEKKDEPKKEEKKDDKTKVKKKMKVVVKRRRHPITLAEKIRRNKRRLARILKKKGIKKGSLRVRKHKKLPAKVWKGPKPIQPKRVKPLFSRELETKKRLKKMDMKIYKLRKRGKLAKPIKAINKVAMRRALKKRFKAGKMSKAAYEKRRIAIKKKRVLQRAKAWKAGVTVIMRSAIKELGKIHKPRKRNNHPAKERIKYKIKRIGGEKNGGIRKVLIQKPPNYYPTERKIVKKRDKKRKTKPRASKEKLRKSLTPGTVCIIVAGAHKGKRVVMVKRMKRSGRVVITGPYHINRCPLKAINQNYLIATSVKLDFTKVRFGKKITEKFFKRCKYPFLRRKSRLTANSNKRAIRAARRPITKSMIQVQRETDKSVIKTIKKHRKKKLVYGYLASRFGLQNHQFLHSMKF